MHNRYASGLCRELHQAICPTYKTLERRCPVCWYLISVRHGEEQSRVDFVLAFLPHLHHRLPFMPEMWMRLASLNDVEVCLREHNRSTCRAHGTSELLEVALLLVRDFVSSTMSLVSSGTAQSIRTAYVRDALPQSRSHNLEARCRRPLLLALGMQVRMSFVSQDIS